MVTGKTFEIFQNVTVYITILWYNNGAKGKKTPDAKHLKEGDDPI